MHYLKCMKKTILLFSLLLSFPLIGEFHAGLGFSWNTIDETFNSTLSTNEDRSGKDLYTASANRLAPVVELGYKLPICNDFVVGALVQWKYLNYRTPNVSSSRGQILPNASFSSINIFGPEVVRDFTSKTRLENEVMLLGFLGQQMGNGYAYLGVGPVCLTASNRVYVTSVHTPNGVGDHLVSTSVSNHQTIWGGAVQAGYQYCLGDNSLININYTYMQSGRYRFNNSINTNLLNGADNPGATTLFINRDIRFSSQEFMLTMRLSF